MLSVEIVEVSPRDGLQSEQARLTTAEKVELVGLAVAAGARRIEAASFVNPKRVPQMADADEVMRLLPRLAGVSYIGLALNERGAERAVAAGCDTHRKWSAPSIQVSRESGMPWASCCAMTGGHQGSSVPQIAALGQRMSGSAARRPGRVSL